MSSHTPAALQTRNHRYAASHGARSFGTSRHAQPETNTYRIVSITSRWPYFNGRPPRCASRTGSWAGDHLPHRIGQGTRVVSAGVIPLLLLVVTNPRLWRG